MMHKLYSLHTKQRRETRCVFYLFTTPNYSKNSMYMYMYVVHGRPQQEVKKQISKTLVRVVEVQVQVHVQV